MMPKSKSQKVSNQGRRPNLTEEQIRLLLSDPDEPIEESKWLSDILKLFRFWPLEVRKKWAKEWREEHRRDP